MSALAVLPIGRATFDVDYARETLWRMRDRLVESGAQFWAPDDLILDQEGADRALAALEEAGVEHVLLLQVTFTDAEFVKILSSKIGSIAIWAPPEPRTGGRLRLNAFCGLHLAAHALGRLEKSVVWAYADPSAIDDASLYALTTPGAPAERRSKGPREVEIADAAVGERLACSLEGKRIGRIGAHPPGFDSCRYDEAAMKARYGLAVDAVELDELFARADAAPPARAAALRDGVAAVVEGLDDVEQQSLDKSLRLEAALEDLIAEKGFGALALRCWPETFTRHGGAICAAAALSGDKGTPCACEADVMGAATQLLLREAAGAAVFLVDVVDVDAADDSAVFWHCGQAPLSMAAPGETPRATVHSNRKLPLLFEFRLKPGRFTALRLSDAFGEAKMFLAGGEILERPLPFSGTAGVARFERPAADVLQDIVGEGLEHHVAIAYGEFRPALRAAARALGLEVVEL